MFTREKNDAALSGLAALGANTPLHPAAFNALQAYFQCLPSITIYKSLFFNQLEIYIP
ncbi:hypothetical protein [Pseudomonas sp. PDM13]|uniref:hypothetical protein n=1 Tax=Pseudomonas sp. PDM13 TaxID=2769255 RepID=UPI0021DF819D|nr:hypothetical protein [Pseudomonas sp. PDM13]MCU9949071.1 hypothetical protein [Pseudomonas sp. PDM13]